MDVVIVVVGLQRELALPDLARWIDSRNHRAQLERALEVQSILVIPEERSCVLGAEAPGLVREAHTGARVPGAEVDRAHRLEDAAVVREVGIEEHRPAPEPRSVALLVGERRVADPAFREIPFEGDAAPRAIDAHRPPLRVCGRGSDRGGIAATHDQSAGKSQILAAEPVPERVRPRGHDVGNVAVERRELVAAIAARAESVELVVVGDEAAPQLDVVPEIGLVQVELEEGQRE